jgi:4-hydroxy-3-methylbut-2-enyl diphosphate reductase
VKIRLAEHCGFCSGVRNAVDLAIEALDQYGSIAVLGDLVHNKTVMDDLRKKGLVLVDSLEKVGKMPLLLRAHGTDASLVFSAREMGLQLIDGTCPLVKNIHEHARELEGEGRQVIVIGDKKHDEVLGIISRLHDYCVVSCLDDLDECCLKQRTGVVIQSTQDIGNVLQILPRILTKSADCRIINTICAPTRRNQEEIRALATQNDCILVIGDPTSANSTRLYSVAKSLNKNTHLAAGMGDIDPLWFRECRSLGVTAGASTPARVIDEIITYIKGLSGDKTK